MATLVPANQSASELQQFAQQRLGYAYEEDGAEAVLMAKQCVIALKQLQLVRPAEMQQGGVGRGSGFSIAWDPPAMQRLIDEAEQFIASKSGALAGIFGDFAPDLRFMQAPLGTRGFEEDCE